MASTGGGGMLVGELLHRYSSRDALQARHQHQSCASVVSHSDSVNGHEFLPSTSHQCDGRSRHRCSWKPPRGVRASLVQSVSVQLRDAGTVSETLLEEIAQDLYASQAGERPASGVPAVGDGDRDSPLLGYVQHLNSLGKKQPLDGDDELVGIGALESIGSRNVDSNHSGEFAQLGSCGSEARGSGESVEDSVLGAAVGNPRSPRKGNLNGSDLLTGLHQKRRVWQAKKDIYAADPSRDPRRRVMELTKSIENLPPGICLDSVLGNPGLKVSLRHLTSILSSVKSQDKALELFDWMRTNEKTRGNLYAYNVVYKILGARQEWSSIDKLLETMASDDCEADFYTYNTLIHCAGKARNTQYATKCFHAMLKKGIAPRKVTYGMIMLLYQKFGRVAEAEFVYSQMLDSGSHSCMAYSSMITLYTRGGLYQKSEEVMEDMRRNGVIPDRDNWLKQLNAYGQQGKVEAAEGVMDTMEESGMNMGIVGYNSMITAYGKAGLYEKASALFQKMKEAGLQPDEVTYSCMIGGCGRSGKLKAALGIFEEMKELQIRPTSSNFNTLINLYGKARNVVGVLRVISEMKRLGCKPDSQTLDALVKAYERAGQTKKVTQVLGLLREAGWAPDMASYGTLLHIYLKCNLQQEALQTFSAMRKAEMTPKEYMCRSLICACKDVGLYEDAISVFTEMVAAGVIPSMESSCSIINVHGLKGNVKEAERLFSSLRSSRQKLDVIAYNVLINVYMRAGMHEEATRIFRMMEVQDGMVPDSYTFHSMLRLYQKCNLPSQAEEVYWKMIYAGIELDEVMCNTVINCCGRVLPVEEIHRIFQEMTNVGFAANNITFNVMIDLYGKAGMVDRYTHLNFPLCK